MHPKLQAIVDGDVVETVDEWEQLMQLYVEEGSRKISGKLLCRVERWAKPFIHETISLSVLDLMLWVAARKFGTDDSSSESWQKAMKNLFALHLVAQQVSAHYGLQDFQLALTAELEKRDIIDPE